MLLQDFTLESGGRLIVMPISRVLVEEPISLGRFKVYPPNYLNLTSLCPIENQTLNTSNVGCHSLREVQISLTGFNIETLTSSSVVAFVVKSDEVIFLEKNHNDDLETLRRLSAIAERAFDLVRLHYCRLDLPDTLPSLVGSWESSGPFLGAMIYDPKSRTSRLIAGAAVNSAIVVKGIGLDMHGIFISENLSSSDGEISAIAIHALSLLSEAMYASNDTSKFARVMTLLEFLANGSEYKTWKKAKGNIACHCSRTKAEYLALCERFGELTSNIDMGGYRTLIVHHGKFIEELISCKADRQALFRELQGYCMSVIQDMIENKEMAWETYNIRREGLKAALGIS